MQTRWTDMNIEGIFHLFSADYQIILIIWSNIFEGCEVGVFSKFTFLLSSSCSPTAKIPPKIVHNCYAAGICSTHPSSHSWLKYLTHLNSWQYFCRRPRVGEPSPSPFTLGSALHKNSLGKQLILCKSPWWEMQQHKLNSSGWGNKNQRITVFMVYLLLPHSCLE